MADTTSLDDLPVAPMTNATDAPVQLQITEQNVKVDNLMEKMEAERRQMDITQKGPQPAQMVQPQMSQDEMRQYMQSLDEASKQSGGALRMPSRDIPMDTQHIQTDERSQTNYVPKPPADYIGDTQSADEIIRHNMKKKSDEDTMNGLYDEIQVPVLIATLFFVFMIPSVRTFVFKYFPSLLRTDGNPTLGGYLYIAVLFGSSYYVIDKAIKHLSRV